MCVGRACCLSARPWLLAPAGGGADAVLLSGTLPPLHRVNELEPLEPSSRGCHRSSLTEIKRSPKRGAAVRVPRETPRGGLAMAWTGRPAGRVSSSGADYVIQHRAWRRRTVLPSRPGRFM